MSAATITLETPAFRLASSEVRRILRDCCGHDIRNVALLAGEGVTYQFRNDALSSAADDVMAACGGTSVTVPVLVGGLQRARLQAYVPESDRDRLKHLLEIAAARLAEACNAAEEIESLSSEVVHCYGELHLLYSLAEALAGQLTVSVAADLILEEISAMFETARSELRLVGPTPKVFVRSGPEVEPSILWDSDDNHRLSTSLRSGGLTIGEIVLARFNTARPFSSGDGKLLDAAGTLAAHAMLNARLYEQLRQQADTVRESESRLRAVLDNVAEGIITIDGAGTLLSFNPAAEQIFAYSQAEVVGQHFSVLLPGSNSDEDFGHPGYCLDIGKNGNPGARRRESVGRRKNGQTFPMDMSISRVDHDASPTFIMSVRDITERIEWEKTLQRQALSDALTGLPNRVLLYDRLQQHVSVDDRNGNHLALIMLDLDRFKDVNDTFGHQCGDLLLRQIGPCLQNVLRDTDTIARLGGDEFAVLLCGANQTDATDVASRLLKALEKPFSIAGQRVDIAASIGLALSPEHGRDADTLLRKADIAMYKAKRAHTGYAVYSPVEDDRNPGRLPFIGELRTAIEQDQLVLHYQPKVNLKDGSAVQVEALVRWQHPQRGLLPPADFIPLAEMTGLIRPLSHWVLNTALRQCHQWALRGLELGVAVNISAQYLHDCEVPNIIRDLLHRWQVSPSKLTVEITESSVLADEKWAWEALRQLHEMGVRISIDDFGTGYSSLGYLKQLPVNEIKIDKLFVQNLTLQDSDAAIVRSTTALCHDLGLDVVAEGAQDQATVDILADLGCDVVQGYHFSRPIPAESLERWLEALSSPSRPSWLKRGEDSPPGLSGPFPE